MLRNPTPSYTKYHPISHFSLPFIFTSESIPHCPLYCHMRLFVHQIKFKRKKKPSTVDICTDKIQIASLFPTLLMRFHKINKRI